MDDLGHQPIGQIRRGNGMIGKRMGLFKSIQKQRPVIVKDLKSTPKESSPKVGCTFDIP
jgi:hypothetical protein